VYGFDRSVPGNGQEELGAFHSVEIPYVFGALRDQPGNGCHLLPRMQLFRT
jgi:carboxylesterase type B